MATISKLPLSSSVNGKQILIAGTVSSSATNIHTAIAGTTSMDEIWLYACNNATASMTCSILWGGTAEPADVTKVILNPNGGRTLLVDGKLLQNALTVQAYASVTNLMVVDGFINRIQ
jgi:hypothetical protein